MGIKKIMSLIRNKTDAIRTRNFTDFKGKCLPYDAFQIINKFARSLASKGTEFRVDGHPTIHLHAIMTTVSCALDAGFIPIFVFDGAPPKIKSKTGKKRRKKTREAEKSLEEFSDSDTSDERNKLLRQAFRITNDMIRECETLLSLIGIPCILAPEEADSQCAALVAYEGNNAYGVVSEDTDHLAFGAPIILRNFAKGKDIEEVSLVRVLECLQLEHHQFVDICIFAGTDYNDGIKGAKTATALSLYREVLEEIKKDPSPYTRDRIREILREASDNKDIIEEKGHDAESGETGDEDEDEDEGEDEDDTDKSSFATSDSDGSEIDIEDVEGMELFKDFTDEELIDSKFSTVVRVILKLQLENINRINSKKGKRYDIPRHFLSEYKMVKCYYVDEAMTIHPESLSLEWSTAPDRDGIRKFMVDKYNFNSRRVLKFIDKITQVYYEKLSEETGQQYFISGRMYGGKNSFGKSFGSYQQSYNRRRVEEWGNRRRTPGGSFGSYQEKRDRCAKRRNTYRSKSRGKPV